MKWLMLCREHRLYSCQRILHACQKRNIELDILDPNRMLLSIEKGQFRLFYQTGESYEKQQQKLVELSHYEAILPRFGTSSTEMGCAVLQHFESQQIPVLNNTAAFSLARNKWQSLQQLAAHELPIPTTNFAGNLVSVKAQLNQFDFPMVSKTLIGSQGNGVMLFENLNNAENVLSTFNQLSEPYLCQQFVAESKGKDIRAFVIGDEVVAAMRRKSNNDDFRANIHQGGVAAKIQLNEAEQEMAVKATKAIGLDVAGIDFIESANGLQILEVNASPGFEGIEQVCEPNIAEKLVDYLLMKLNESKAS